MWWNLVNYLSLSLFDWALYVQTVKFYYLLYTLTICLSWMFVINETSIERIFDSMSKTKCVNNACSEVILCKRDQIVLNDIVYYSSELIDKFRWKKIWCCKTICNILVLCLWWSIDDVKWKWMLKKIWLICCKWCKEWKKVEIVCVK